MQLAVIGTGYVGLVSGVCFAELGFDVACVDKDSRKIEQLSKSEATIYEPGLQRMLDRNSTAGRLTFTTNLPGAVKEADIVLLAVGTPSDPSTGAVNLDYVFTAATEVAEHLSGYTLVVTKSTVPVGTGARLETLIAEINPKAKFDIASNPEFLREGAAVEDFMKPLRIVLGSRNDKAEGVLLSLYKPLRNQGVPIISTDVETAEMSKYAANGFLATKVAFINEMADLCEKSGADVQTVARVMGMDRRIGGQFLRPGPGFGGSCFPKDTRALASIGRQNNTELRIIESVISANDNRKHAMAAKILTLLGSLENAKTVALLGLTFKPDTDDIRESPALTIVDDLLEAGVAIRAYDPEGMQEAKKYFSERDIYWAEDVRDCMSGADATVITTEWAQFSDLNFSQLKELVVAPLLIDLRNMYAPQTLAQLGWEYHCIGR